MEQKYASKAYIQVRKGNCDGSKAIPVNKNIKPMVVYKCILFTPPF